MTIGLAAAFAFGQTRPAVLLGGNQSEVSFVDVRTLKELAKTTTGRGPREVTVTPEQRCAAI